MGSFRARTAIATALLVTAGCDGRDGDENPGTTPEVPTYEGTIDLEIGAMDGDDPYLFSRIEAVAADERGRMIVADRQSNEIRVFEPDGVFAFHLGGYGEGPGELTDICCVEFGPDGDLWVRESERFSVFRLGETDAEYQMGLRSPQMGVTGVMAPFTFDELGRLVAIGHVYDDDGVSLDTRYRVLRDGTVDTLVMADRERQSVSQETVPFERGPFRGVAYVSQPFGARWIHAHANGGVWAEAVTSDYSINYHSPDDAVALIEGPPLPGPTLSPAERERAQVQIDRDLGRTDLARHPFGIPARKPLLARMFFDRGSRLWIEKSAPDGAEMREADVYEGTTLAARYRWPRRIREFPTPWATESVLYGVTADSLGVQRVARVRFAPTP